ncbi:MAG TPA: cupredoxin family copper-binding protein [Acetobacteraceae bacterium]|jgi:plastocyanin|nr:cupredoxin family copper-binding protein [Acetobacteraceae bacterium]
MADVLTPGRLARRTVLRRAAGAGMGALVAAMAVRASHADDGSKVTVDNFTFVPPVLHVKVGTTVTWTNHDDIPHSIVCPALNLHSHAMDTDDSFSYTFKQAGTFSYMCGLHPFMHGQVDVTA